MEPLGWVIFITSNVLVVGLTAYCFYRVLTIPREHMHAPLDIDTHDLDNGEENETPEPEFPGDSENGDR